MKNYLKILVVAIFIGGILAFFFYKDIKNDVIAVTNTSDKGYLFQVGVFKSSDNANNFLNDFPNGVIYKDDDLYRVIIGFTIDNREYLESYFTSLGINYYVKEIIISNELKEEIVNYDRVIVKTTKEEVLNKINKSCLELFLEYNT